MFGTGAALPSVLPSIDILISGKYCTTPPVPPGSVESALPESSLEMLAVMSLKICESNRTVAVVLGQVEILAPNRNCVAGFDREPPHIRIPGHGSVLGDNPCSFP